MAIGTGQANRSRRMHSRLVGVDVAANATRILLLHVGLGLADEAGLLDLGTRAWAGHQPQRKARREEQRATGNTPSAEVPPPQIFPEAQPRHEKSSQNSCPNLSELKSDISEK
jgi:hypothetical protein